jgi:glycosyltransferase involved in cell wall biosynthesis
MSMTDSSIRCADEFLEMTGDIMIRPDTNPPAARRSRSASLIVPVFNSQASLHRLYESIRTFAASSELDIEIVFVDDASTDDSLAVLRDIRDHASDIVVIDHARNRGQPTATLTGIFAARHEIVVTLDDDLQHDPADIPDLLAVLDAASPDTLVMGIADAGRRPRWRGWSGICANVISNLFLAKPLPLRLTTFCAFHRQICAHLDPDSNQERPLMTELVQAAGQTLTVPVRLHASIVQRSRYGVTALFRLFMSRTRCYSLSRVLFWLGCAVLLTIADIFLATRGLHSNLALNALLPFSAMASVLLAVLTIRVQRQARALDFKRANRSA